MIGPLVIAGVLVEEENVSRLKELGVRDSKTLPAAKREKLAVEIREVAVESHLIELSPGILDEVVHRAPKLKRLNYLEATTMADVIEKLRPEVAYVDASDVVPERFGRDILSRLTYRPRIVSEHYADSTYPVVSAASILAKVMRDQRISELRDVYGDFGSGYSTDDRTIRFLEQYYRVKREFPPIVRHSWDTLRNIVDRIEQSKLRLDYSHP